MKTVDVNPEWKVSTHRVEELTHVDSKQPVIEVLTHWFEESTHKYIV